MDGAERRRAHKEQTTALYAAIGEFAVKFEHLTFALSNGIELILSVNGLRLQSLSFAVVADQSAESLRSMFNTSVVEVCKPTGRNEDLLKRAMQEIQAAIEERNDIIHRTWLVGWADITNPDFARTRSHKMKKTGAGLKDRQREATVADFDRATEIVVRLASVVNILALSSVDNTPFDKNLDIDASGRIVQRSKL